MSKNIIRGHTGLWESSSLPANGWWACYIDNMTPEQRDKYKQLGKFEPENHKGGYIYQALVCWTIDAHFEGGDDNPIHIVKGHTACGPQVEAADEVDNFYFYVRSDSDLSKVTEFVRGM